MQLFRSALIFDPQNVSMLALYVAMAAWAVLLIPILVDIWQQSDFGIIGRLVLGFLVISLPGVGGILYAFISIIKELRAKRI